MKLIRTGELTQMVLSKYGADFDDYQSKYVALSQVRGNTGWGVDSETTADLMILGNWPSSGQLLEGFEIKVSRSDWLNEVKAPYKAKLKKYCDRWWLVISDQSFVKEDELPEDWGLMAVVGKKLKVITQAPDLSPEPMPKGLVASLLRHNGKEHVPVDVVNERIKDATREAEANAKHKYSLLLEYIKEINKVFGIKMDFQDKNQAKWLDASHWTAKLQGRYSNYESEELVALIKVALNDDLKSLQYRVDSIKSDAKSILEVIDGPKK